MFTERGSEHSYSLLSNLDIHAKYAPDAKDAYVPKADPEDAGAPYEAGLPLFACLALRKPHASREGVQAVPLFMRAADAEASRDAAAAAMPLDTQGLELLVIPLPRALERMVAQPGDDGLFFEIIPPGDSVDFVRKFLAAPSPAQAASIFPDMDI